MGVSGWEEEHVLPILDEDEREDHVRVGGFQVGDVGLLCSPSQSEVEELELEVKLPATAESQ